LLIDMTADERRGTGSIRTDQIGKVFIVVGQNVRQCLICEGKFTRRSAAEHTGTISQSRIILQRDNDLC
jgi:hypothetical protein